MQIITLRPMPKSDVRALSSGAAGAVDIAERTAAGLAAFQMVNGQNDPARDLPVSNPYRSPLREVVFADAELEDPEPALNHIGAHADIYYVDFLESVSEALAILENENAPDAVHIVASANTVQSPANASTEDVNTTIDVGVAALRALSKEKVSSKFGFNGPSAPPIAGFVGSVYGALMRHGPVSVTRMTVTAGAAPTAVA
ncbi:MAG: hypothetical protein AAF224_08685 [Pseudomonadota bacterium]